MHKWRRLTALKLVIAHVAHSCKMHYIATAYHRFVGFMVNTTSLIANIVICMVQYWLTFSILIIRHYSPNSLRNFSFPRSRQRAHGGSVFALLLFCVLFFLWTFNLEQCSLIIITCHFYLSKKKHVLHNHSQIVVTTFHFVWFFKNNLYKQNKQNTEKIPFRLFYKTFPLFDRWVFFKMNSKFGEFWYLIVPPT